MQCSRREMLRWMGGAAAAAALPKLVHADAGSALAGRRPNVVVILTDDQGYGDVRRHGHPFLKTPNLDRLHDESLRFTDFQVSPYCIPTRAALLTGRNPARCGITGMRWRLTPGLPTIADELRGGGYATGVFGKWHLGFYEPHLPENNGFDETLIFGGGLLGSPWGDFPGNSYFDPVLYHNGTPEATEGYCTDIFFDRAWAWMQSAQEKGPFYAYIATNTPHEPFVAPEADAAAYREAVKAAPRDPAFLGQKLDDEKLAHYYGMIANLDRNVGRFLDRLDASSFGRDTLVVYLNDNGTIVGGGIWNAGMRGSKATVYSGGARAISFWRWPGTLKPDDVPELAAHVDIFPTLTALAGVSHKDEVARGLDGLSLVPLLEDPTAKLPDRMLFDHQGTWRQGNSKKHVHSACTVRWGKYHLVRNERVCEKDCALCGTILWLVDGGDPNVPSRGWELYDLAADPGEQKNVIADHPDVAAHMEQAYQEWWDAMQPFQGDNDPRRGHTDPLPFPALYWRHYQGPGPNNVPPPEGFLDAVTGPG